MEKKILSVFLIIAIMISMFCMLPVKTSAAQKYMAVVGDVGDFSGSCGENVTYFYDSSSYTLTISGTGPMKDYGYYYGNTFVESPWHYDGYPTASLRLKSIVIEDGVTTIGNSAFRGCTNLNRITIPDSVVSIGNDAFMNCNSLESIVIPNSVTSIGRRVFSGCLNLKCVVYPYGLEEYTGEMNGGAGNTSRFMYKVLSDGTATLAYYHGYESDLVLPETLAGYKLTRIGDYAFSGCTNLNSVSFSDNITSIGNFAFSDCSGLRSIEIPDSVESIGQNAFSGCTNLAGITIPSSVTYLGSNAFYDCENLTSIVAPKDVCNGNLPFAGCPNAKTFLYTVLMDGTVEINGYYGKETDVILPDTLAGYKVSAIGEKAFAFCKIDIERIEIPDGVKKIGYKAFDGCTSLVEVVIPDSVTCIEENAFYGCSGIEEIELPDSVSYLGEKAFSQCTNLKSIDIPDSLENLSEYAFHGCTKLEKVNLPDGIKSIGRYAFCNCENLSDIILPEGLSNIEGYAFAICTSLERLTIPTSITSIGYGAFLGCEETLTVYVTEGSYAENYVNSNSNYFYEIVITKPCGYILGDANGDEMVNVYDVSAIQRHIAQLSILDADRLGCADTDKDNMISISDASHIQRFLAQLIPQL